MFLQLISKQLIFILCFLSIVFTTKTKIYSSRIQSKLYSQKPSGVNEGGNPFSNFLSSMNDKLLMENAERLGRRETELLGKKHPIKTLPSLPLNAANKKRIRPIDIDSSLTNPLFSKYLLDNDGCVSVKNVLSSNLAFELLDYINRQKLQCEIDVTEGNIPYEFRFGSVNNRRNRYDMFLPYDEPIVQRALHEIFHNLKDFIFELAEGQKGIGMDDEVLRKRSRCVLHELSCIISDPGSPTQCVHCDTPYLESVAPLYTFFVALQDVKDDMGHTTYLPKTHTKAAHDIFNAGIKQKEDLISCIPPVRTSLKQGDVVIFDSRVLHCGGANTSDMRTVQVQEGEAGERRVLFYFTLTSGDTERYNPNPSRGMGSIRLQDRMRLNILNILA